MMCNYSTEIGLAETIENENADSRLTTNVQSILSLATRTFVCIKCHECMCVQKGKGNDGTASTSQSD